MWKYTLISFLLLIGAATGYFYYTQDKISKLTEELANTRIAYLQEQDSLKACISDKTKQAKSLINLEKVNKESKEDIRRYLSIFKRHDINKLAEAKPGLVEKAVNKGTKELFEELENETTFNNN